MPYSDPDSDNFLLKSPRPTKTYHTQAYERINPKHLNGKGKTVFITGGATGIGRATAQAFAEAGVARVALIQRTASVLEDAKRELEKINAGTEILTFQASVTDSGRMKEILKELGTVDILVLSATGTHPMVPATQVTTEQIHEIYKTNVVAGFDLVNAFLAVPAAPGAGPRTIINITSGSAQMTIPHQIGYGSSKAAFAQVMQHFASETKAEQVRMFSLHPGVIWTPLVSGAFDKEALPWEDVNLPAHFCTWLAGDESTFLHGRFLWAQWDVDELIQVKDKVADPSFLTIGLVQ